MMSYSDSNNDNNSNAGDPFGNSSLDHALLESLFYTEMMHMNDADSNVLSNQLLSSLTADGLVIQQQQQQQEDEHDEVDPNIAAEKDLLNDFGVDDFGREVSLKTAPDGGDDQNQSPATASASVAAPPLRHTAKAAATTTTSTAFPPRILLASPDRKVSSLTASVAPDLVANYNNAVAMMPHHHYHQATAATTAPDPPYFASQPLNNNAAATMTSTTSNNSSTSAAEEEKRSKLVNQFATLASRLGIVLPTNVLQSLSQVAGTRTAGNGHGNAAAATATATATAPYYNYGAPSVGAATTTTTTTDAAAAAATATTTMPMNVPFPAPPTVQQLAATAEAAITSVSRSKRARSESPPQEKGKGSSGDEKNAAAAAAAAAAAKRRKKPRLVECEQKLAELKAENAMLKRHLANHSAQSHQLDQDRLAQEQRMRQMADSGSTEEELNEAIQTFQDMYSDYGRRRHQEIVFHLDQLLRLANPTNFTKMGLWTMGQQSKNNRSNPIASILQKELGITPQQGKKIVDQREKIRNVCANMKEVRGSPPEYDIFVLKCFCRPV